MINGKKGVLKRILLGSMLSVFVLIGQCVAISAIEQETLQSKIDAISGTGEVDLSQDYTEDIVIKKDQNITIDLTGHKLTNLASDTITVENGATLTIKGNGTVDNVSNGKAALVNNGTVTLNGGTFTRSLETGVNKKTGGNNTYYNILNHGTLTINDGTTVSQTGKYSSLIDNGYYTYTSTNDRSGYVAGTNQAEPSITINGGSFSGGVMTLKNDDGGVATINGGTFSNNYQNVIMNCNQAAIHGGTFNLLPNTDQAADQVAVLINGKFSGGHDDGATVIDGGMFSGNALIAKHSGADLGLGTVSISGGYYTVNPASYVIANYVAVGSDNSSYEYKVTSITSGIPTTDKSGASVELDSGASFTNLDTTATAKPVTLEVNALTASEATEAESKIKAKLGDGSDNNIVLYNISIKQGDTKLELASGSKATLSIPVPANMNASQKIRIFHISDEGTVEELTPVTIKDGMIQVPVTGFSSYAVVQANVPNTSDNSGIMFAAYCLGLTAVAMSFILVLRKKYSE